jgi:hypothetical protein
VHLGISLSEDRDHGRLLEGWFERPPLRST